MPQKKKNNAATADPIMAVDFAGMYREQCRRSGYGQKSSRHWDQRAASRDKRAPDETYTEACLSRMDFTGVQTVLDIGCGTGNLAIPLARRVRHVHALDFSPEMLAYLQARRRQAGIKNLTVHQLSWTDSWRGVPRVDLALCSRALGVADLRAALTKMTQQARRRCYAITHVGGSFLGPDILARLGRSVVPRPDYIYAVNILYQMGLRATVDFLQTTAQMPYATPEAFLDSVRWRIGELSPREITRLKQMYRQLPEQADGQRVYQHHFTWAMLGWETTPA